MNTFTKELKQMIGMISACISCAFVALVALFVRAGGMDIIGTGVLVAVLVAFVAVGSSVIVDEYHAEQRRQIARAHWYELDAVRYMRDEYADTLAMVEADARDERYNTKRLSSEVESLTAQVARLTNALATTTKNKDAYRDLYRALVAERDELTEELDEYRFTVKAERERLADI